MPPYERKSNSNNKPAGKRAGNYKKDDREGRPPRKNAARPTGHDNGERRERPAGYKPAARRNEEGQEQRPFRRREDNESGEQRRSKKDNYTARPERTHSREKRERDTDDRNERRPYKKAGFSPRTEREDGGEEKRSYKKAGYTPREGRDDERGERRPARGRSFEGGRDAKRPGDARPATRGTRRPADGNEPVYKKTDTRPGKGYRKDLAELKPREERTGDDEPNQKRFKKTFNEFRKYNEDEDAPSKPGGRGKGGRFADKDQSGKGDTAGRRNKWEDDHDDWDDFEDDAKTRGKRGKQTEMAADEEMPLNKYIAHSGECSRRDAAELVKQGKVKVNDALVLDPGHKVNRGDRVTLSGKKLILQKGMVYILLNKPKGYITTTDDEKGRRTVIDIVQDAAPDSRLYPVGRLDRATTGLLLITNDGVLAQKLSHPSFNTRKVYQVTLDKPLTKADFEKVLAGVELEDGVVQADELAYLEQKNELGIEIHSGRNRVVRRIFESMGYTVEKLDRVMYAGLTKKNLPRGKWRFLSEREIVLLKHFKN